MNVHFEIDALQIEYEENGNPLCCWMAFDLCRGEGLPIPEWVLGYLDDAASELISLARRTDKLEEKASAEVYKALGMSQRHAKRHVFDRYQIFKEKQLAVSKVRSYVDLEGYTVKEAYEKVANEMSRGADLVRKWYYEGKED